jgi:hypothetical protein
MPSERRFKQHRRVASGVRRFSREVSAAINEQLHYFNVYESRRDEQRGSPIVRARIHIRPAFNKEPSVFSRSSTAHISAVAPASLRMFGSAPPSSSS